MVVLYFDLYKECSDESDEDTDMRMVPFVGSFVCLLGGA